MKISMKLLEELFYGLYRKKEIEEHQTVLSTRSEETTSSWKRHFN
jgi:hypothetical protein